MKKLIRRTVSAMLALLLNAGLLCAVPAQAASADAPAAAVETAAVGSDGEDGSETAEQEPSAAAETQTETISGKSVPIAPFPSIKHPSTLTARQDIPPSRLRTAPSP